MSFTTMSLQRLRVFRDDRGAALPVVILVVLAIATIVGTVLISSLGGRGVTDTGQATLRASAAASAGIAEAEARVVGVSNPATLCPSTTLNGSLAANGTQFTAVITCAAAGVYEVSSEGRAGSASQTLKLSVTR